MAIAPPRPCEHPRCGRFGCTNPAHHVLAWRTRVTAPLTSSPVVRVRGRELQRRRSRLFARQPWCVLCLKDGKRTRATIRDHIVPLAEGGRDDATNEQALCRRCSDTKTHAEAHRGVRRSQ
jgi:5-methylcytosine-specific restriction protein A